MNFDVRVHPSYSDCNYLVSCNDKRKVNIRMEPTILEMLKDIEQWQSYLHKYWFNLKYFVWSLHAVYKLLYKILHVIGNTSMASKLKCLNIVHGPQPIQKNLQLFRELVVFTQIQTAMIGTIVQSKLNPNIQDTISRLFFRLT